MGSSGSFLTITPHKRTSGPEHLPASSLYAHNREARLPRCRLL